MRQQAQVNASWTSGGTASTPACLHRAFLIHNSVEDIIPVRAEQAFAVPSGWPPWSSGSPPDSSSAGALREELASVLSHDCHSRGHVWGAACLTTCCHATAQRNCEGPMNCNEVGLATKKLKLVPRQLSCRLLLTSGHAQASKQNCPGFKQCSTTDSQRFRLRFSGSGLGSAQR